MGAYKANNSDLEAGDGQSTDNAFGWTILSTILGPLQAPRGVPRSPSHCHPPRLVFLKASGGPKLPYNFRCVLMHAIDREIQPTDV
jgi:hypothetical protein